MKKRPGILLLDHTAALGGAEFALLRLLRYTDRARFDCRVLLFSDGPLVPLLAEAGITVDLLPFSSKVASTSRYEAGGALFRLEALIATMRHVWRVSRFIRTHDIDLVYTHSLKSHVIGGLACRLAGRPCIWHLHVRLSDDYMPARTARIFQTLTRTVPQYLIANSESTLATVQPLGGKPAWVIYPGIEFQDFNDASSPPDPSHKITIGIIGRISLTKGQDIFLRAGLQVLRQFPQARLQVIGSALFSDVGYEKEIHDLAASLGISANVEFTGFVSDVAGYLRGLDVFVMASTTAEPFGQILVEAMAAGKPVIATNAGGVPEIVTHLEHGLLVPPGDPDRLADAVCQLLCHPEETARMAQRGRQRAAERFTIERTARDTEAVYETILT